MKTPDESPSVTTTGQSSRREFLTQSGAVVAGSVLAGGALSRAYAGEDNTIRIGLVGCGGRGTGAARDALLAGPNMQLVAMGDIFMPKVQNSLARLLKVKEENRALETSIKVKPDHCFAGLDAYQKVIDSGVDYVLLCTPPGFRPAHIEYAVKKGVHIFAEKPCATDSPGVRRILALADEMKRKKIGLLSGFNSRHVFHYIDLVKAIHDGRLGDVMSLHAYFNTGNIWYRQREEGMTLPEYHFHNWFHVDWLCGDHIVEQHVHNLDRCNWIMQAHPVKAYGMGGRQYHTGRGGNIYDHFTVEFEYENGVRMTSMCRQIGGTDAKIGEEIVGTKGLAAMVGQKAQFTGENARVFREHPNQHESHRQEHIDFIAALRRGEIPNDTQFLCDSTLTAIMGRESAYTGKYVTWDGILNSELQLSPPDLAAWDGSIRSVPKPGMPRV
ncbi:MAG: Gfo/Idh/MocA family oxidoreductase [Sedimentisphaerales bacterium]|nr:Gfo/Idh/MocA family oxidoreductase [Sedimentisphaerales bacterium]